MHRAKISVVTVVLNAADSIEKCVASVLGQTYDNIEYLVIDGGSTDGTLDILARYRDRIDYLVSEPDRGQRRWTAQGVEDEAFKRDEQAAVYRNRRRRRGDRSKRLHRKRGQFVERAFEHVLDDGGMRRAHLREHEKIRKRYIKMLYNCCCDNGDFISYHRS